MLQIYSRFQENQDKSKNNQINKHTDHFNPIVWGMNSFLFPFFDLCFDQLTIYLLYNLSGLIDTAESQTRRNNNLQSAPAFPRRSLPKILIGSRT